MTASKIIELLKENEVSGYEFEETLSEEIYGKNEIVHEEGNCEGGGEYSELVRYFKDHNVYIKLTGTYYSYNGTDWNDDYHEVKPVEKTIIVYEGV